MKLWKKIKGLLGKSKPPQDQRDPQQVWDELTEDEKSDLIYFQTGVLRGLGYNDEKIKEMLGSKMK